MADAVGGLERTGVEGDRRDRHASSGRGRDRRPPDRGRSIVRPRLAAQRRRGGRTCHSRGDGGRGREHAGRGRHLSRGARGLDRRRGGDRLADGGSRHHRIGDSLGIPVPGHEREERARLLDTGQSRRGGVVLVDPIGARVDRPDVADVRRVDRDPRRTRIGRRKRPTPLKDTGDAVLEDAVGGDRVVHDPNARSVGHQILRIAIGGVEHEARRRRHAPGPQKGPAGELVDPVPRRIDDPQVVAPHRHPLRPSRPSRRPLAEERAGVGVDENVSARVDDPLRRAGGIRRDPEGTASAENVAAERRSGGGILVRRAVGAVGDVELRRGSRHGERHGDRGRQEQPVG